MRSPWSFLFAGCYLTLGGKSVVGSVIERQSNPDVTVLHAWRAGTDLGPIYVTPDGTTTLAGSGPPTYFHLGGPPNDRLFAAVPSLVSPGPLPHAVLKFSIPVAQFCTLSGPVIFTTDAALSSAGCNVSTGFSFDGNELKAGIPGAFEVCDKDAQQIYFTQSDPPVADDGCVKIQIVRPLIVPL